MAEVLHDGTLLAGQSILAAPVVLVVTTKNQYAAVEVLVGGQVVPSTSNTPPRVNNTGLWYTTVNADLTSAVAGPVDLTVRLLSGTTWTALPPSPITVIANRPGPSNTGPRITPEPGTGAMWVTEPGQTYTGKTFVGQVIIKRGASFVDCLFLRGPQTVSRLANISFVQAAKDAGERVVFDHCEFDGQNLDGTGYTTERAVGFGPYTMRGCNVHHASDGLNVGSNTLVEDSWIHDLVRVGSLHPDCIQTTGGVCSVIRRNTLDCHEIDSVTGAPGYGNSAVMVGCETEPELFGLLIEGNWCNGGNYTINVRNDGGMYDDAVTIRGNHFGGDYRYGDITAPNRIIVEDNTGDAPLVINRFGRSSGAPSITCPVL